MYLLLAGDLWMREKERENWFIFSTFLMIRSLVWDNSLFFSVATQPVRFMNLTEIIAFQVKNILTFYIFSTLKTRVHSKLQVHRTSELGA